MGSSVNDFIPSDFCSVHYASVDDAVRIIKKLGIGYTLAKADDWSAFRIIPVHPKEYHLLGMKWRGEFYVDCCLPMGLASSCRSFERLITAMEWVARRKLDIPYIIIKFPYNARSDWLKQRALSEIKERVDGIKLASKYLLRNLDKFDPNLI